MAAAPVAVRRMKTKVRSRRNQRQHCSEIANMVFVRLPSPNPAALSSPFVHIHCSCEVDGASSAAAGAVGRKR
ncbi:hypothetical protein Cni_G28481 [Canna indica]|uniref:Uncharacterized protein n=1 Tax=Canna indica TaxID=4628 RepID=A0AAQ3QQB2_9LILI|nr:hypothetical protein Cni_G28481 [Canna indica]